ncbi:MAG: hypothetical protein MI807_22470 [Verrucomicrobiales bacterium]|nr:hypothetical protein [Verrucomicrobiales bacterium]
MKKLFAIFCAVVLLPSFSVQAWIGGPFSNNTYFGENGDDGIYEASASAVNGIGLFRFAVGNDFAGTQDFITSTVTTPVFDDDGNLVAVFTLDPINSGNLMFGGFGQDSNVWFIEGVSYIGQTNGTVNSVTGNVAAVATADDGNPSGAVAILNSGFKAKIVNDAATIPVTSFSGVGKGAILAGGFGSNPTKFRFTVFGTKVSSQILFGT